MSENWNRKTWRLAGPVMLSNVSVPLLGAVDIAVVGQLPGPQYVGAVAVGAMIFTFVYHACNFLRMGTTGLTAQALGAGDPDEVRVWLMRAVLLALAIALVIIALQWPIIWLALEAVRPSPTVAGLTDEYFSIRVWGAPAALFNYALLGWFFGIQNTRAALIVQVFMNGLNIILDLWFVMGFGWGVAGVAWATLISEYAAVGLGCVLVGHNLKRIGGHWDFVRARNPARIKRMVRVNGDIFLRSLGVQMVLVVITAVSARLGDTVLAANAVLLNLNLIVTYALDGFANAAEALAGEALGAGRRERFRAAVRATSRWALLFSSLFAIGLWLLGPFAIDIMSAVPEVRETARTYLIWAVTSPLVAVWAYQLDGVYIGATWTREMRNGMFISTAVFFAGAAALTPVIGNHGLWLSYHLFMASRALTLWMWYQGLFNRIGD